MGKKRKYNGKRVSKGEKKISEFLDNQNIEYIREKTFDSCLSSKNVRLRFDFYLPNYNLLIEFQGQHHYFPVNKGKRAYRVHYKTKQHDQIKKEFVNNSNLRLIEISYDQYSKLDKLLRSIIE